MTPQKVSILKVQKKKNLHADINFFYFSFQIREERANLTALKVLSNVNRG